MPLENAQFIDELNPLWPLGTDPVNSSDDHHRNTKRAVQQSFPNISDVVTASAADLNLMTGAATDGSSQGLNPTGTRLEGYWAVAPNGYLPCDGAAIDPQYADLIALIGPNTPDERGRFARGWSDDALVDPDGPRAPLSLQAEDFKSHTHTLPRATSTSNTANRGFNSGDAIVDYGNTSNDTGGDETRPVNTAVYVVVKW